MLYQCHNLHKYPKMFTFHHMRALRPNVWLRADLPHEGPGNHSVLVNLDAAVARSAARLPAGLVQAKVGSVLVPVVAQNEERGDLLQHDVW